MVSPKKIVFFFLLVGAVLLPLVIFFPEDGIKTGPFTLKMLSWQKILGQDTIHHADISNIVDAANNLDSLTDESIEESVINGLDSFDIKPINFDENAVVYRLAYNDAGKQNLHNFFSTLLAGRTTNEQVRILHYGDSQIEGDRMTSFIREKLQSRFGGYGVGLVSALQPYESFFSIIQFNSGKWQRYSTFGARDKRVPHKKYGVMAAFSRFAPIAKDSLRNDTLLYQASISFKESKAGYSGVRKFRKVSILYGNSRRNVSIKLYHDGELIKSDSLKKKVDFENFTYIFPEAVNNITIEFSGYDSPDIYAIDLSSMNGLSVDNIGMRGSSGTFFTSMDYSQLAKTYQNLNVGMFILQFGGNVMPYIKDSSAVEDYGRWFGSQLRMLHKIMPQAAIVVVGPSDMSMKNGENYVTYDYLPYVRTVLKNATVNAGFSFWDMYEAMGGYNSMPEWVKANPPLAGSDYVHFSPKGAKLISNMLYNALLIEFTEIPIESKKAKN
jgi:lysophospholipase L1-like esterase